MPRSYWKIHLDSKSEESAKIIINRCIKIFGRQPVDSSLELYFKGGFMGTLVFFHNESISWPEVVMEVMVLGQKLGTGWCLFGNIAHESNAVLSKQDSSSHISVSGVQWAEWQVDSENE